jgi:hypothetical protein
MSDRKQQSKQEKKNKLREEIAESNARKRIVDEANEIEDALSLVPPLKVFSKNGFVADINALLYDDGHLYV